MFDYQNSINNNNDHNLLYFLKPQNNKLIAYIDDVLLVNKLYTSKKVKTFEHDYSTEYKFCPKIGKPLWKEENTPKKFISSDKGELNILDSNGNIVGTVVSISSFTDRIGIVLSDKAIDDKSGLQFNGVAIIKLQEKAKELYDVLIKNKVINKISYLDFFKGLRIKYIYFDDFTSSPNQSILGSKRY